MKMSGGPATVQIKIVLLAIALIIAVATFVYTHTLVTKLEERERQIVELYATSLQYVADPSSSNADFTFLLDVIKRIDFPLILTDENNNVLLDGMGGGIRNLEIDSTWDRNQLKNFLDNKINEFNETNELFTQLLIAIKEMDKKAARQMLIKKLREAGYDEPRCQAGAQHFIRLAETLTK